MIKGQIELDFTHVRFLEESNSQRQKVSRWFAGAVRGRRQGSYCLMGTVSVWEDKKGCRDWLQSECNEPY